MGLQPPKMAVEFDGHYNNLIQPIALIPTNLNQNTRFDPDFSVSSPATPSSMYSGAAGARSLPPAAPTKHPMTTTGMTSKTPTAEELWPFVTGTAEVRPKPAVSPSDGTIYVGSGTQGVNDGRAFAINPDGTQKWVFNSPGSGDTEFRSSPALDSNGRIYIGSNDNHLYCLNPANGNQNWSTSLSGNVKSGPAIDEARNRVYVGSDNKFYARNKNTGDPIWTYPGGATTHNPSLPPS